MTPKQQERIKKKIASIRQVLTAEKRKYGGYDDSRGLRYIPIEYFMQLGDYPGGLRYLRWFEKQFPDDGGFPHFLFEWTVILFKNGKLKEAEKKAFQTFASNSFILNRFLGIDDLETGSQENSDWDMRVAKDLSYSINQPELADFGNWLSGIVHTVKFSSLAKEMQELRLQLETIPVGRERSLLVKRLHSLEKQY